MGVKSAHFLWGVKNVCCMVVKSNNDYVGGCQVVGVGESLWGVKNVKILPILYGAKYFLPLSHAVLNGISFT